MRPKILTDEQIAEARELREGGMTYKAIAERFGVTLYTIRYWVLEGSREAHNRYFRDRYANNEEFRGRVKENCRRYSRERYASEREAREAGKDREKADRN